MKRIKKKNKSIFISMIALSLISVFLIFLSVDNNTNDVYADELCSKSILSDISGYRYFTTNDFNKVFGVDLEPYIVIDNNIEYDYNECLYNLNNGYYIKAEYSYGNCNCDDGDMDISGLTIYNSLPSVTSSICWINAYRYCCSDVPEIDDENAIYLNGLSITSIYSGTYFNYFKVKDKVQTTFTVTVDCSEKNFAANPTFTDKTQLTQEDINTLRTACVSSDNYYIDNLTETKGSSTPITLPYVLTSDITLYPIWAPLGHNVTIDANGGIGSYTFTNVNEITSDDFNTIKQNITREGYYIQYLNVNSTGAGIDVSFPYTVTSDVTLYCIWEHNNYEITIDLNGGQFKDGMSFNLVSHTSGVSYLVIWDTIAPRIEKDGYVFKGLAYDSLGTNMLELTEENGVVYETQDTTYYVIWEERTYHITINGMGGLFPNDLSSHTFDIPLNELPFNTNIFNYCLINCFRQGYYLVGIATTQENATNGINVDIEYPLKLTDDVEYFLIWKQISSDENFYNISNLFFSIIDAPLKVLRTGLNFEVFGFKLSDVVITILSVVLVGFIIKKFI